MKTAQTTQENIVITGNDTLDQLLMEAPAQVKAAVLAIGGLLVNESAFGSSILRYLERDLQPMRATFEGDNDNPDSVYAAKWLALNDGLNMGQEIAC